MRDRTSRTFVIGLLFGTFALPISIPTDARSAVTREEVEQAIKEGVRFLRSSQRRDGGWPEPGHADAARNLGRSALAALALLTAGEPADSPTIRKALTYLREYDAKSLDNVYAVSLQTMVFSVASPKEDLIRISANVAWLEQAQIKPGDPVPWPGPWGYRLAKTERGDNSNAQYALLGLHAASEAGVPVKPEVWALSRRYFEQYQNNDGSWDYHPNSGTAPSASMTCAGISGLVISGLKRYQGQEVLLGENGISDCGKVGVNPNLRKAINWLGSTFRVGENYGGNQLWKYYYLYGLERAGRLTGMRYFGRHDWYREGAEELVHDQDKIQGFWRGVGYEADPVITTSFALLFLAKGRAPVLVNKLKHGPADDWNNDLDDVRNLVNLVSQDWKNLLTWQVVDPSSASMDEMLQAPIAFINGHEAPEFSEAAKRNLRDFVEQGGFIIGEACCGRKEFDSGFRSLMKELFNEPEYELKPLAEEHPVWRARWDLTPDVHPLWGIEHGCRTVVIYSPEDLSCYWNQMEAQPQHPRVVKSQRVGQNIIDYATGRELPPDKLSTPEARSFKIEQPKRSALQIAKLRYGRDWNIAPLAVPNLTAALRDQLKFDVVINHKELFPTDPNIVHYPLIYLHGRTAFAFGDEEKASIRRHLNPGAGTLFVDSACGSPAFDASFRRFVAELLPDSPLVPIPREDELYSKKILYDLSDCQYSKAAGGGRDYPQLEGVKINGRWAVIYSKFDIGCALERHQGLDCKGYTYESALRIAANIVIRATLP